MASVTNGRIRICLFCTKLHGLEQKNNQTTEAYSETNQWSQPIDLCVLWRRACKRAGIEDLRFHDLRHEATSRFFEKGLNVMEVAAITGHKDLRMLQRYTHLRAEDLAKKLGWVGFNLPTTDPFEDDFTWWVWRRIFPIFMFFKNRWSFTTSTTHRFFVNGKT